MVQHNFMQRMEYPEMAQPKPVQERIAHVEAAPKRKPVQEKTAKAEYQ
jgi:hypothetical protein